MGKAEVVAGTAGWTLAFSLIAMLSMVGSLDMIVYQLYLASDWSFVTTALEQVPTHFQQLFRAEAIRIYFANPINFEVHLICAAALASIIILSFYFLFRED